MAVSEKNILKAAFPKAALIRPRSWSAFVLSFHKVLREEVFHGMLILRVEEGSLHRDLPTPFSTGMQIPPGGHGHVHMENRDFYICSSFIFSACISARDKLLWFCRLEEVQPSIYLIHTR